MGSFHERNHPAIKGYPHDDMETPIWNRIGPMPHIPTSWWGFPISDNHSMNIWELVIEPHVKNQLGTSGATCGVGDCFGLVNWINWINWTLRTSTELQLRKPYNAPVATNYHHLPSSTPYFPFGAGVHMPSLITQTVAPRASLISMWHLGGASPPPASCGTILFPMHFTP